MSLALQTLPTESASLFDECVEILSLHKQHCAATDTKLTNLLAGDTFLSDLSIHSISLEDVKAQIAVAKGKALIVYVERDFLKQIEVIIPKIASKATVYDLKQFFRHAFELEQKHEYQNKIRKINNKSSSRHSANIESNKDNKNESSLESSTTCIKLPQSKSSTSSSISPHIRLPPKPINISWRYIWKTYVFTFDSQPLLDDRQSLASYGIANKSRIKFVKRVKIVKHSQVAKLKYKSRKVD